MSTPVLFFAFANDPDAHLDLLKTESREVLRALQDVQNREYVRVHREESADVKELFEDLAALKDQVAIFHYAGHAEGTHLRLEGGGAGAGGLAQLLGEQSDLKLVFLNGCSTRGQVDTLLEAGVKAVIATSVPIQDTKAQEFAVQFYQALAGRRTIGQAFSLAEAFLKTKYDDRIEVGIVTRGLGWSEDPGSAGDEIPWGLYVKEDHRDAVLNWKLPYFRPVGLPADMIQYIGKSFTANRYIVLVLDEMTKYNPDIYAQMVEQRGDEVVRKDSKYYPELIIKNFPWPIGSQIRLLKIHDSPDRKRLVQLVSTYIRASQLLYYVLLSDLWEQSRKGALVLPAGFETGQPLSPEGFRRLDFLGQTVALHRPFADQGVAPYVPEYELLAEAWENKEAPVRKAHAFLEELRGRMATDPPTTELDKLCTQTEQAVSIVLGAAAFMARYQMLTVRNIMIQAPRFEDAEYELDMGPLNAAVGIDLNLYQDAASRTKTAYANSHSVVLARDEDHLDDCLNLSPFVIDKNTFVRVKKSETTEKDKLAHVFVMAYEEDDRVVYLGVDHSVEVALQSEGDQIHTRMTQADFTEGRNLAEEGGGIDNFGFGKDFGLDEVDVDDDSARVFALLQEQYDAFKADLLGRRIVIQSPFKFLDAFDKEDKDRFFGRAKETAQLYNAVHASNLVLVYGASGTGKTSLINCGLGNQFMDSDWLPLFVRRGIDLNRSLHLAVDRALRGDGAPADDPITDNLRSLYLDHYRPIYLIFDQFEELYILGTEPEQRLFHDTVTELLKAGLQCKILLVIREEYIAYLSEFEKVVPSLFDNRLRIEKMNDTNLVRVIGGTAQYGGIELVEPRQTIEAIIENLRDKREGVDLTNLQVYLDRLWREDIARQAVADPEAVTFDPALVDRVGKLENVLSDFLDDQITEIEGGLRKRGMAQPDGVPLEVLFALVTEDGTKRPMEVNEVVESLPKNRRIGASDVLFCMEEFARIKLLRQLAAE